MKVWKRRRGYGGGDVGVYLGGGRVGEKAMPYIYVYVYVYVYVCM